MQADVSCRLGGRQRRMKWQARDDRVVSLHDGAQRRPVGQIGCLKTDAVGWRQVVAQVHAEDVRAEVPQHRGNEATDAAEAENDDLVEHRQTTGLCLPLRIIAHRAPNWAAATGNQRVYLVTVSAGCNGMRVIDIGRGISLWRRLLPAFAALLHACGGSGGSGDSGNPPPGTNPPAVTVGLDSRPSNATCIAPSRNAAGGSVTHEDPYPASPGFSLMTKILRAPGDATRWFVLEKNGRIRVFDVATPHVVTTYLDFSGAVRTNFEGGMLGMAFGPEFPGDAGSLRIVYRTRQFDDVGRVARRAG